ncbi:glycosyl hydrolase family 8 [Thermocoleostomius sinensis]|uniref:Glycosyl hydrolase family 8 n=1 Tax=Thermocoleostomius sinensis A174 TaxID=2016057 RepID=A0A9E9C6A1_9CYAN|nr:glycosyl hydrolase family 8 [Thermocoleostomius sinensis]WAL62056.1 glycosyl hydrolase family 8 [Thermocoleostomius sinensis A174]
MNKVQRCSTPRSIRSSRRITHLGRSVSFFSLLLLSTMLLGCVSSFPSLGSASETTDANAAVLSTEDLLQQSWQAYQQRFIQADGRVIDRESNDRSTSEAQAYALLRAVFMDDRQTFDRVLQWSENNLQRRNANGSRRDQLWSWKWGRNDQGEWTTIDGNFASDADVDAITALIFAARRWGDPAYLELAQTKLPDLWRLSTVSIELETGEPIRYFLPGPLEAFQPQPDRLYLNPSYLAPYAFRLFAQVDPDRDWLSLVDSSYDVLTRSAEVSDIGLPSNWVALNTETGEFQPVPRTSPLQSIYSFDAYRVWWRIALDATWFEEPRAEQYLQQHLQPLKSKWRSTRTIPAQISLQGKPLVNYESTAQYAMLYAAFRIVDPAIAEQIRQQKLVSSYENGFWDNDSAYYSQNLSWFGLFPSESIRSEWLLP